MSFDKFSKTWKLTLEVGSSLAGTTGSFEPKCNFRFNLRLNSMTWNVEDFIRSIYFLLNCKPSTCGSRG